jgi:hypothetical protein
VQKDNPLEDTIVGAAGSGAKDALTMFELSDTQPLVSV